MKYAKERKNTRKKNQRGILDIAFSSVRCLMFKFLKITQELLFFFLNFCIDFTVVDQIPKAVPHTKCPKKRKKKEKDTGEVIFSFSLPSLISSLKNNS